MEYTSLKYIFTIFGNSEFACEFACMAAKRSRYRVMLADLDTLNSTVDLHLNILKQPDKIRSYVEDSDNTGLNIVMDAIDKKILTHEIILEAAVQKKPYKNLFILTGNYNIANYEYYNGGNLVKLIEKCSDIFDIQILLVNEFIYDSFTYWALKKSDYNLIACSADLITLRKINRFLALLEQNQHISMSRSKFIAYEYKKDTGLSEALLNEITNYNYIGHIRYSRKRVRYRNRKAAYMNHMEDDVAAEYARLLFRFAIIPQHELIRKISAILRNNLARFLPLNFAGKEPVFGRKDRNNVIDKLS